jgi:hypothetical protein
MRCKKILGQLIGNILFFPFKIHRYFVMQKRPVALFEAQQIMRLIDHTDGCPTAYAESQRLKHLCEHYFIDYAELGISGHDDLDIRVTSSITRGHARRMKALEEWGRKEKLAPVTPPKKQHRGAIPRPQ